MIRHFWLVTLVAAAACAGPSPRRSGFGPAGGPQTMRDNASAGVDTPEAIAADYWEARLKRWPTDATFQGDRRYDDRLADLSDVAHLAWLETLSGFQRRVEQVSKRHLQGQSRLTARVLAIKLRDELASDLCHSRLWGVDQLDGWQVNLPELGTYQIVDSPAAATAYLSRVRAVGPLIDQELANTKRGLEEGYVAARVSVQRVVEQLDVMLKRPIDDTPYLGVVPRARHRIYESQSGIS